MGKKLFLGKNNLAIEQEILFVPEWNSPLLQALRRAMTER